MATQPKMLRPFFSFWGAKWRIAKLYPQPSFTTILEPFAGSASYALRYYNRQVVLNELDPTLFSVWDYLIAANSEEIMRLPLDVEHVDDVKGCPEAKALVGLWLNKAGTTPKLSPSAWMRTAKQTGRASQFWGESIRSRIARQVPLIQHWKVLNKSYDELQAYDTQAITWFVDPPYQQSGKHYRYHAINYAQLADWCKRRSGQVIVCEQAGATWLNFRFLVNAKALEGCRGKRKSCEVVWTTSPTAAEGGVKRPKGSWTNNTWSYQ